jgi:hypothetical protein
LAPASGLIGARKKAKMKSVFGFNTASLTGGDYPSFVKYDARAGRIFRMDRVETANGFENKAVDITDKFKAIFDFENVETGCIDFTPGSAPDFKMVRIGSELPERPSAKYKNGIRLMLKLSNDCAGESPAVRELAGTSKAFLAGMEALYEDYLAKKAANPGKLPVVGLEKVTPIKTGSGAKSSTNFQPTFSIVGWASRGDLTFVPRATPPTQGPQPPLANGATPPTTGSTRAQAPSQEDTTDEDFG